MSHSRRTFLEVAWSEYGRSLLGAPLLWLPPRADCEVLLMAGLHGEEPETTVSLSRAVRSVAPEDRSSGVGVILCANPDGVTLGTRGNANGVDLNRNFPTQNWQAEPTTCRWHADESEELPISTGAEAGSEPETKALISLIEMIQPMQFVSLHGPLACVDDPHDSELGRWIAGKTNLPLVPDVGYPTPGSMGTWAAEKNLPIITWEFPPDGIETLSRSQVPVLTEILRSDLRNLLRNSSQDEGL